MTAILFNVSNWIGDHVLQKDGINNRVVPIFLKKVFPNKKSIIETQFSVLTPISNSCILTNPPGI